jgi:hypothetical protein
MLTTDSVAQKNIVKMQLKNIDIVRPVFPTRKIELLRSTEKPE